MQPGSKASPDSQRLFLAIPCPLTPPVQTAHDELRAAMRVPGAGLRVVDPATLHLTLKFLGPVAGEQQAGLRAALAQLLQDQEAFTVQLAGAGSFQGVLWLGLAPQPQLTALAARLDTGLEPFGFAPESKPFQAHVTLARLNPDPRFDWRTWLQRQQWVDWGSLPVNGVHLYRSETHPDGTRYAIMHTVNLR